MVTRKTQKTLDLLGRVYGPDIPSYPGSPMEGLALDEAELILHELGHQVQMPRWYKFKIGAMASTFDRVGKYLDKKPKWFSDRHEMRAVAIQLIVARRLGLRLIGYEIIKNSTQNTRLFNSNYGSSNYMLERYEKLIARMKKTHYVQKRVGKIMTLINQVKEQA